MTQESPGLNPDKICEYCVVIHAFKNFATDWEKRERSVVLTHCRVFLWIGTTIAFFSFLWENACQTRFEDNIKMFTNGFIT